MDNAVIRIKIDCWRPIGPPWLLSLRLLAVSALRLKMRAAGNVVIFERIGDIITNISAQKAKRHERKKIKSTRCRQDPRAMVEKKSSCSLITRPLTSMNALNLILHEMRFRKWNAVLSIFSVATAVISVLGAILLLRAYDLRSEQIITDKENQLQAQLKQMEDEYRKITKRMGFNVMILPEKQNMADFYADNYASTFMPEDYAHRLAKAKNIVTVRHILPMLQQKIEWAEQHRKVLLIGVQGQMTSAYRGDGDPLIKPVPPGSVAVGSELHRGLGLKEGDPLVVNGKTFRVSSLHPERGSIDDITLWIDLPEAQSMLHREGLINCIVALECECAWANLPKVRAEILGILPDTRVVELSGKALARAEAREEAARNAKQLIEREKQGRQQLRNKREELLALLVPVVVGACVIWVGLLAWINVRDRRVEIGVLRALGYRTGHILQVFLGKAALLGAIGTAVGVLAVTLVGTRWVAFPSGVATGLRALPMSTLAWVALFAPLATVTASWLPALLAAHEDPAVTLRDE